MICRRPLHLQNLPDRRLTKPRELGERHKQFFGSDQQPEAGFDTCVTSATEVTRPGMPYLLDKVFDQKLCSTKLRGGEPFAHGQ